MAECNALTCALSVGDGFSLDLRRLRGDTPPTRVLYPEMDSWGRVAAARVKEDETYRGLPHPFIQSSLSKPFVDCAKALNSKSLHEPTKLHICVPLKSFFFIADLHP